jgi:hypothetical protein
MSYAIDAVAAFIHVVVCSGIDVPAIHSTAWDWAAELLCGWCLGNVPCARITNKGIFAERLQVVLF